MESLRIAWVNQYDPLSPFAGGTETHQAEVSLRLSRRGHSVTLFAERPKNFPRWASVGDVRVIRPAGRMGFRLWAPLNLPRESSQFDVVILDLAKVAPWVLPHQLKVPQVVIVRHLNRSVLFRESPWISGPFLYMMERWTPWLNPDGPLVTESHNTARELVDLGMAEERIQLIRPGVPTQTLRPDAAQRSRTPLILFIGRLKPYKRAELAIRAFSLIRQRWPDAELVIAGRGPDQPKLEQLVRQMNLGRAIHFLGWIPAEDLPRLYQQAWVHVQPSRAEGWGLTVMEAAACGTPTVAFRTGALPESVGPPGQRFLVPDGDVEGMAGSLDRALHEMRQDRDRMVKELVDYARQFSWDRTAEEYERLLLRTVEKFTAPSVPIRAPSAARPSG